MRLDEYFKKRKRLLKELPQGWILIVSEATADGGKAGKRSEVGRELAAHLIAEGRARAATPDEIEDFRGSKNRPSKKR